MDSFKDSQLQSPTPRNLPTRESTVEEDLTTDVTQSEFVCPDYEFDQFDMELAENIGNGLGEDGLDGETPATADDLVDEDFENELGTCAAQQMTVQEALDVEYRDISRLGIIQVAGDDRLGRKVIVFSACRLPVNGGVDLQRLYEYIKKTLEQYVAMDYSLVYLHYGFSSENRPPMKWLIQAYRGFDRNFKKNLKALYLVHPTTFVLFTLKIFRPIISKKFGQKINYIHRLSELSRDMFLDQLPIPQRVRLYDAQLIRNDNPLAATQNPYSAFLVSRSGQTPGVNYMDGGKANAKPCYLPHQVFGVSLEHIKSNNGGSPIPQVLEDSVMYIRQYSLDLEGLFRRSARSILVQAAQQTYNEGGRVKFENFDDPHLPAVLIKTFFRELSEPILTYELYDEVLKINNFTPTMKIESARDMISNRLPEDNYRLLKYLMEFLQEVSAHAASNKMTDYNLGIVFGPNLLWSKFANVASFAAVGQITTFVQLLISNFDDIFVK
ncbi:hypothetical protein AAHC03_013625 [Spirometra sp. Aus1]